MWCAGPSVAFTYQGKAVSAHIALLQHRLPYFYQAVVGACRSKADDDIGFANFHPASKDKIIDLPVPAFEAVLQWAYSTDVQYLFSYKNDTLWWSAVALILGADELRAALKRHDRWEWITTRGARVANSVRSGVGRATSHALTVPSHVGTVGLTMLACVRWVGDMLHAARNISAGCFGIVIILYNLFWLCVGVGFCTGYLDQDDIPPYVKDVVDKVIGLIPVHVEFFRWAAQVSYCVVTTSLRPEADVDWCAVVVRDSMAGRNLAAQYVRTFPSVFVSPDAGLQ